MFSARLLAGTLTATTLASLAAPALADPPASPWQGTQFAVRQEASTVSFLKSAEPTWNPYWLAAFDGAVRYALGPHFFVRGRLAAAREVTNSDATTMRGEWWLSDTTLALGGKPWASKALGLSTAIDGQVVLPTSKVSKGRSLIVAPSLGVGVTWQRSGTGIGELEFALKSRGGPMLHEFTTAQFATPWLATCALDTASCGRYSHSGVRNPQWRFQNALQVGWQPARNWSLQASAGLIHDLLHPVTPATLADGAVVAPDATDPNLRVTSQYAAGLGYSPAPGVDLTLALEAAHNVLRPDSTVQRPLFNRYAAVTLELALQPDRIAELLD